MFFKKEDAEKLQEMLEISIQLESFHLKELPKSLGALHDAIDRPAWLPELVSSLSELSEAMRGLVRMIEDKHVLEEMCINTMEQREMKKDYMPIKFDDLFPTLKVKSPKKKAIRKKVKKEAK